MSMSRTLTTVLAVLSSIEAPPFIRADDAKSQAESTTDLGAALSPEETRNVENAVERGLVWLSGQQNADGSFDGKDGVSPGVTCYAVLAWLSCGHQPGQGGYGRHMMDAIDFVLSTQRTDGAFTTAPVPQSSRRYDHAISGLMLSEVFGSMTGERVGQVREAIERGLRYSRAEQLKPKPPADHGGWRYNTEQNSGATLPPTVHELIFLRSAGNSGFEVPQVWIDEGLAYVARCYIPKPRRSDLPGIFRWRRPDQPGAAFYNCTTAAMFAFQLHGRRDDPIVRDAELWLMDHPFPRQGENPRYYYGCYYAAQAMAQVDGNVWQAYYSRLARQLLADQEREGWWKITATPKNGSVTAGTCGDTALAILTLTLPDQLLPIHQR